MDTANSITVRGSSSIVDGVHYKVDNLTLDLTSDYPYKMFKPTSNKPDIYLTITSLSRIDVAQACGLTTTGPITAGELGLVIMSKYADVNLDLDCQTFYYWDYSLSGGQMRLAGKTGILKIWNYSLMNIDASEEFDAVKVYCDNSARSPCYVKAATELNYNIRGQGNIYYYGDPATIVKGEVTSSGRLIKAD